MDDKFKTSDEKLFPLERSVYNVSVYAEIPNFTSCSAEEGFTNYTLKKIPEENCNLSQILFEMLFSVCFYANGDKPENEGYISVLLTFAHTFSHWRITHFSLTSIVAVEDVHGDLRYLQSFAEDHDLELEWGTHKDAGYRFGLEQYLKRAVILNSSDLLHGDTLKINCDVEFSTNPCLAKAQCYQTFFNQQAIQEKWFKELETTRFLRLDNKSTPLCTSLQQRSIYFQQLFNTSLVESLNKHFPIADEEYDAFFNMMCYIRFDTLDHIYKTDDYIELYVVADKYQMLDLKTHCSQRLRSHTTEVTHGEMLNLADMCNDLNLKQFVIQYILENKDDIITPMVVREMFRRRENTKEFLPSKNRFDWFSSKNSFRRDRLLPWTASASRPLSHYGNRRRILWQSAMATQNRAVNIPSPSVNITPKREQNVANLMQEFQEALLRLKPKTAMEITESIKNGKEIDKTSFDFYK